MQIKFPQVFTYSSPFVTNVSSPTPVDSNVSTVPRENGIVGQGDYTVNISPLAREMGWVMATGEDKGTSASSTSASHKAKSGGVESTGKVECQSCRNRRYKDESSDSSVSFQTATRIAPGAEESLVRAHEQEHVSHEQLKARESGGKVVSQNVSIHYQICPDCGRMYAAGGTTTTVTKSGGGTGTGNEATGDKGRASVNTWA